MPNEEKPKTKKGVNGRSKGSEFERKLARDIIEASGAHKGECYRTPLSGGHPFACPSDLVMSERLRAVFHFLVEAKHHKNFRIEQIFTQQNEVMKWLEQACEATLEANAAQIHGAPLVVARGNFGLIVGIAPMRALEVFFGWDEGEKKGSRLVFRYNTVQWCLVPWADMMRRLNAIANF